MSKQISTFQNALITGASSGIGAAFARLLAEQGCNLTLVARRTERLVSMKETLEPRHSIRVNVLTADLSIPEDRTRVEDWIKAQLDLDILINNAGFGMRGRFDQIEINRHQNMIDLMLIAPIRLTHAALPGMLSRQHGAIINVASATAFFARQSGVTYRSTKSFLVSFSESLAVDLSNTGVRIQALCPAYTISEFHDGAGYEGFRQKPPPRLIWKTADEVARISIADLSRGKVICVPGRLNGLFIWLVRNTPFNGFLQWSVGKISHRR